MQAILSVFLSFFIVFGSVSSSTTAPGFFDTLKTLKDSFSIIGEIDDHDSFVKQMSKKVNLENYNLSVQTSNIAGHVEYTYESLSPYLSYDPELFKVKIDQTEFSLPIRLSELVELGWNITEINYHPVAKVDWNEEHNIDVFTLRNASGKELCVSTGSAYSSAVPLKDSLVTNICLTYYNTALINGEVVYEVDRLANVPDITICDGLSTYSTLNNIVNIFGAPHEIIFSEYSVGEEVEFSHIELEYKIRSATNRNAYLEFHIYPRKNGGFLENDFITLISFSVDRY